MAEELVNQTQGFPYHIIVPIIAVISASLGWVYKFRPRITNERLITQYVDDNLRRSVEQREYTFSWGKSFFLRKILVLELPFGALIDLTIQPLDLMEIKVPKGAYEDTAKGNTRKLILKDKKYFKSQNINKIFVLITRPITVDYKDNVKITEYSDFIEVENKNIFELKNYQIEISKNIDLTRLRGAFRVVQGIRFDLSLGMFSNFATESLSSLNQKGITPLLIIESLPPRIGTETKKIQIPLG